MLKILHKTLCEKRKLVHEFQVRNIKNKIQYDFSHLVINGSYRRVKYLNKFLIVLFHTNFNSFAERMKNVMGKEKKENVTLI